MNHLFIHSDLDDAGLSPAEFRVLAHLARRKGKNGVCCPGVRSIATTCRLNKNTVLQSLKTLESRKLIGLSKKAGMETSYSLSIESGLAGTVPKEGTPTVLKEGTHNDSTVPNEGTHCLKLGNGLSEKRERKVIQQGNPSKEIQGAKRKRFDASTAAPPFQSPQFVQAWGEWVQHRTEIRKPLTRTSVKRIFSKLANMGETRATATILHSIEHGWQGLYEPKWETSLPTSRGDGSSIRQDVIRPKLPLRVVN